MMVLPVRRMTFRLRPRRWRVPKRCVPCGSVRRRGVGEGARRSVVVFAHHAPSSSQSSAEPGGEFFGPPDYRLAWAWAASAAAAASLVGSHHYADGSVVRGHRSSVLHCESPSRNGTSSHGGDDDPNPSDSFFDLAQRYLKSGDDGSKEEGADPGRPAGELTEATGTSGEGSDEDRGQESGDIRGMLEKALFKLGEFQSSTPESGTAASGSDADDEARNVPEDGGADDSGGVFFDFLSFAKNASVFAGTSSTSPPDAVDIDELIRQAQIIAGRAPHQDASSGPSFLSQALYFQRNAEALRRSFESSFAPLLRTVDAAELFRSLPLAAAHYYLEREDSIKTPSWKRRVHRFRPDVEVSRVEELNAALRLSELSYADSVDEVRGGLEGMSREGKGGGGGGDDGPRWELVFCDTESRPHRPSHFLAVRKDDASARHDDALRVLMVVRGTKGMSDLITDAMMEAVDYDCVLPGEEGGRGGRGVVVRGKAHGGMVRSGRYLVERHRELLRTMLRLSKKRRLEITLIGHSLGAGAAAIAALEWNSKPFEGDVEGEEGVRVSARAVGFGCPATLSRPLSLAARPYVTSVVADADFIPRMSGATLVNLLLDVRRFDYRDRAERDVEQALRELRDRYFSGRAAGVGPSPPGAEPKGRLAFDVDEEDIRTVMGYVRRGLEKAGAASTAEVAEKSPRGEILADAKKDGGEVEKVRPVLFPPGECIHFYRDGSGISGTYVPCDFFNEIDVARTMIEDHLISSGYRKIFLHLMRDFHKDDHFSFESEGIGK